MRTLEILRMLALRPQWSLNALADAVNLPKSTVHRFLQILAAEGFVVVGESTYEAGPEFYRTSTLIASRDPIIRFATPLLEELTAEFQEASILSLLLRDRLQLIFAACVESRQAVRFVPSLDVPMTMAWGATGRVMLAYLDEKSVDTVLAATEPSPVTGKPLDVEAVRNELVEIRKVGFAKSHGQRAAHGIALSVPFFNARNEVVGSISLATPDFRFDQSKEPRILTALFERAAKLSHLLGYSGGFSRAQPNVVGPAGNLTSETHEMSEPDAAFHNRR